MHKVLALKNQAFGGYAPGEYEQRCKCEVLYTGDKHSQHCPECALKHIRDNLKMYKLSFMGNPEEQINYSLDTFGEAYVYQLENKEAVVLDPLKMVKYTKELTVSDPDIRKLNENKQ